MRRMNDTGNRAGTVGAGSGVAARSTFALAPGKRTLTEGLASGGARRAPPARVADATEGEPNAVLRVVVYNEAGEVIQRWESKGRWEGGLPQKYTATRGGKSWSWSNTGGSTIRVNTNKDGRGGVSVEAWAQAAGKKIVVYAHAVGDVTFDEDASESDQAPGHAKDPKEGEDGSTTRVKPDGKGAEGGDSKSRPGGDSKGVEGGDRMSRDGGEQGASEQEDERIADEFERDLDIDPEAENLEDEAATGATSGGNTPGGEGSPGGEPDGRTGDDTRTGGTGPGGDQARPDGDGKGSDAGGKDGSEGGSKDGQQGGAEGGMYGGEGKLGDDGIPSGSGLFGGLIGIPAALKGLVEVALIIADGNITGAGSGLFRKGLGKIASAVAARRMIASEARRAAVKETKAAINAIKADKVKGPVWNAATKAEREAATRRIYWELQRKYFDAYRKATRQAKREAQAALDKAAGNVAAQQKLKHAELAEEATDVMPVAGRLPQNHNYAGQAFPSHLLPEKYRSKGLRFTKEGYPDFAPHARQLLNGKNHVKIEYTGSRRADFAAATKKAKLARMPDGWTWHHAEDMKTMYLVPDDLHQAVRHSGGVATYKHGSGVPKYGD
jgi:A nuclease of the HNH/ENDO VII superfamily with conserved WHH